MNHSGDAAEQIVRLSLEGVEVVAKITGNAAKEIATFLVAALKSKDSHLKLKGKARMTSMLKSNKALEIFSVKDKDLQKFVQGAKQYGIVYCVLRNRKNSPDGLCDIMVKADDAPKIARVVDRFEFAKLDKVKIENEIVQDKSDANVPSTPRNTDVIGTEPEAPNLHSSEDLANDLLSSAEGKAEKDNPNVNKSEIEKTVRQQQSSGGNKAPTKNESEKSSSFLPKGRKSPPSERISENKSKTERATTNKRPSTKKELHEIKARRAAEADTPKRDDHKPTTRPKNSNRTTTHNQPKRKGRSKKSKGRVL